MMPQITWSGANGQIAPAPQAVALYEPIPDLRPSMDDLAAGPLFQPAGDGAWDAGGDADAVYEDGPDIGEDAPASIGMEMILHALFGPMASLKQAIEIVDEAQPEQKMTSGRGRDPGGVAPNPKDAMDPRRSFDLNRRGASEPRERSKPQDPQGPGFVW